MSEKFPLVNWIAGANIYEVNLRQYTTEGTFKAFEKELPRLKHMGVDVLWFMPITPISKEKRQGTLGSYYACSDYISTNPEFGSIDDFKKLVTSAHDLGLKVMMDWVANHTGWDHHWTKDHPDFYKKDSTGNFYDSNGWIDVIDLDYTNLNLRKRMIGSMLFWVRECDIDGFRCDMAHLVPIDFWREARKTISEKKQLFWLAESEDPKYHAVFDATYAWELLHTMEAIYKGQSGISSLDKLMQKYDTVFPKNAMRVCFTSNHDENSHSGSEYERMGTAAKAFAVLCATWPKGIPLVYSGQELPNKNRLRFFEKDKIQWTGNNFLHDFYSTLFTLHKTHPALHATGKDVTVQRIHTTAESKIFAFVRQRKERQVVVLINLSPHDRVKFEIKDHAVSGKYISVFSGIEVELNKNRNFELQAWEYVLYQK